MAKRRLQVSARTSADNKLIQVVVRNPDGFPDVRMDGGAWQPMVNFYDDVWVHNFLNPSVAIHLLEYRANDGEVKICDFEFYDEESAGLGGSACNLRVYGFAIGKFSTLESQKEDIHFISETIPTPTEDVGLSNGVSVPPEKLPICASYDGFVSETCGTSSDASSPLCLPSRLTKFASPAGNFSMGYKFASGACGNKIFATDIMYQDVVIHFSVTPSWTDVTTSGGSDGTITNVIHNGSGDFTFTWADGPTTQNRTGLTVGQYNLNILDNVLGGDLDLVYFIDEPSLVPVEDPYFEVPKIQSLHFHNNLSYTQTPPFDYFDKMAHKDFYIPNFKNGFCYDQIVCQSDIIPLQVRSSTNQIITNLIDEEGGVVTNVILNLAAEFVNQVEEYSIRIQNHGGGQSRVYFTGFSSIPIPLTTEDNIEIVNNADGFNGVYTIQGIDTDNVIGQQYLIINKNYVIGAGSTNADGLFLVSSLDFNIYEGNIDFSAINTGRYYIETYIDGFESETKHVSEPIKVVVEDRKTNLIEFSNSDNFADIDYSNGITHKLRVPSVFFKRQPSTERNSIRNTDGKRTLLSAKPQRTILLEIFNIPPYLIETLAVALDHDILKINGVEFTASDEGLNDTEYKEKYGLVSASVLLEQKEWFRTYNGTDLGVGIDEQGGFITTQEGFIKR